LSDVVATVDTYLAMWNETDPATRAAVIEKAWAPEGHYLDPMVEGKGYGGLSEMVDAVQAQFPGHRFTRSSAVDEHHGFVRFGWTLVSPDGATVVGGLDVAVLAPDGRLARLVGFLGDLSAAA